MKRMMSFLLAVLMGMMLIGCGSKEPNENDSITDDGSVTDNDSIADDGSVTDDGSITDDGSATDDGNTADDGSITEKQFSRGKIEGDTYVNEYLGFTFTKPASWVFATDEEIAAAANIAVETLLGEDYESLLESVPAVFDMMVTDTLTNTNINIVCENLTKTFATNITEEQYIEVVKQQLTTGMTGMTFSFPNEMEKVKLGESEFSKVVYQATVYDNITLTQIYYLCKVDGYMVSVIVTSGGEYSVSEIEAMFS